MDVLAVNAPYVPHDAIALMPPEARLHEPGVALDGGPDGLDVQRRVVREAGSWLAPGGRLLIETSVAQASLTRDLMTRRRAGRRGAPRRRPGRHRRRGPNAEAEPASSRQVWINFADSARNFCRLGALRLGAQLLPTRRATADRRATGGTSADSGELRRLGDRSEERVVAAGGG